MSRDKIHSMTRSRLEKHARNEKSRYNAGAIRRLAALNQARSAALAK